ncbi:lipoprotein-releasing system transmembrane subunit LolC, partial [Francisella tularensis subsp. holarctica]|nr:lipoprotein-releasing system transmembrane subunit LolC [Francisella tularensis subsp. holarctica]
MSAKKRNRFISIISARTILGISLGVAVIITVMSEMNGIDQQIKSKILIMVQPLKVYQVGGEVTDWPNIAKEVEKSTPS